MMAIAPVTGSIATQDMIDEGNRISKESYKQGLRVRASASSSSGGGGGGDSSSGKGKGKKSKGRK